MFKQTVQKPREVRRHCVATVLQIVRIPKMQDRQCSMVLQTWLQETGGPLNLVCGAGNFDNILSAHVQSKIKKKKKKSEWQI